MAPLKEPKFVTGYSTPERDAALMRGELDAIGTADDHVTRNLEWIEKGTVDLHLQMEIPKGDKHPHFGHVPEIETFVKSERERKVLVLFRNFRLTGSPFIAPPAMPKDRLAILKQAINKSFADPEFRKEYKKLVSDDPAPLSPEANEKAIRELPRDPETIEIFNKLAGPGPLPPR